MLRGLDKFKFVKFVKFVKSCFLNILANIQLSASLSWKAGSELLLTRNSSSLGEGRAALDFVVKQ